MATTAINTQNPTLLDMVNRQEPGGGIAQVVEQLTYMTPVLEDATFVEGNLPTGHQFVSRTALPSVGWKRFNEGVTASKSRTDVITDTCGMLEGRSQVDCDLAELSGNAAAFRASEDKAYWVAMRNELESSVFYSSTKTAPEKIMGFSPRLDALSGIPWSGQVIQSGISASGNDQTSIWLVGWSPETVFMMTPKGVVGGMKSHDMGVQMVADANSKRFRAYESVLNWKVGVCVKDARYLVRIANIDTSAISSTGEELILAMIKAYHQLQDTSSVRPVFYMNRTVSTYLHLQARNNVKNATLSIDNVGGKPVLTFLGIPCRMTDALLNTEAPLT